MIVTDVSVAAKWFINEEFSDLAVSLADDCATRREELIVPHLFYFEFTNILRQQTIRGGMSPADANRILDELFAFPVSVLPATPVARAELHRAAFDIATRFGLRATYDAHYVALAEMHGCDLWTADQRLVRQLDGGLPFVRWIGDYDLPGQTASSRSSGSKPRSR